MKIFCFYFSRFLKNLNIIMTLEQTKKRLCNGICIFFATALHLTIQMVTKKRPVSIPWATKKCHFLKIGLFFHRWIFYVNFIRNKVNCNVLPPQKKELINFPAESFCQFYHTFPTSGCAYSEGP